MKNAICKTLFSKAAVTFAASMAVCAAANAASLQFIRYADFASEFSMPEAISVNGVSQDGSTLIGTIRLGQGGEMDRGFYYRSGILTTIEGYGAATLAEGISADGKTLVGHAIEPGAGLRLMYISNLGVTGQNQQLIGPPSPYNEFFGAAVSTDGSTVGTRLRQNGSGSSTHNYSQVRWTPTGGFESVGGLGGVGSTNTGTPFSLSADGSVVAGSLTSTTAYRWEEGGSPVTMRKGANNTGSAASNPNAISADGSIVAVTGGIWRAGAAFAAQPYKELPGYFSKGSSGANVSVTSAQLRPQAMTAGAEWIAGDTSNGSARTAWVWEASTDTTYEISQFLADHGVDMTGLFPGQAGADPLLAVSGITLNDDVLTIVGNTHGGNSWVANVTVPEPGCLMAIGLAGLVSLRRRVR